MVVKCPNILICSPASTRKEDREEGVGKLKELWRGKRESLDSKAGWMLVHVLRTKKFDEKECTKIFH